MQTESTKGRHGFNGDILAGKNTYLKNILTKILVSKQPLQKRDRQTKEQENKQERRQRGRQTYKQKAGRTASRQTGMQL